MSEKSILRKNILLKRDSLSPREIQEKSKRIFEKLERCQEFKNAKKIFVYLNFGTEVETLKFIKKYWNIKDFYIPKIVGKEMYLLKFTEKTILQKSNFGVLEPQTNEYYEGDVDLVITPGVAFDKKGNRLGYGKGYYDRYFSNSFGSYKVGVCYSDVLIDALPTEQHDKKVDIVITEKEIINSDMS